MIRLYKAYILPHLEFCSPLLLVIGKVEQGKMEDSNEYPLRTLLGVPKSTTYETLLKRAGIQTLHQRRPFQSLILRFKCLNGQGPSYISNNFNIKQTKYKLRGMRQGWNFPILIRNGAKDHLNTSALNSGILSRQKSRIPKI